MSLFPPGSVGLAAVSLRNQLALATMEERPAQLHNENHAASGSPTSSRIQEGEDGGRVASAVDQGPRSLGWQWRHDAL